MYVLASLRVCICSKRNWLRTARMRLLQALKTLGKRSACEHGQTPALWVSTTLVQYEAAGRQRSPSSNLQRCSSPSLSDSFAGVAPLSPTCTPRRPFGTNSL